MGYDFDFAIPDAVEGAAEGVAIGAAGIATGIFLIVYLLLLGVCIVFCVLNAVGLYRIAKRRGIHHAWLAWVPVGCNWLLGSISDHYQYVVKQKVTKRRKILLTLSIICIAMGVLFGGGVAALIVSIGRTTASILSVALMVISYLIMLGLAITIMVFCYISYFDLFRSCRPDCDVLFLVLSIFFGTAIFTFACSGSDKGMPARRPAQNPAQIPYEPVVDTPVQPEEPQAPAAEEIPVVEAEIVEDPE